MIGSCLIGPEDTVRLPSRTEEAQVCIGRTNTRCLRLFMPFLFLIFAFIFAPEKPAELASICERHNPEIACKVW